MLYFTLSVFCFLPFQFQNFPKIPFLNLMLKFRFSEKATQIWRNHPCGFDISKYLLTYLVLMSKPNFVAFLRIYELSNNFTGIFQKQSLLHMSITKINLYATSRVFFYLYKYLQSNDFFSFLDLIDKFLNPSY